MLAAEERTLLLAHARLSVAVAVRAGDRRTPAAPPGRPALVALAGAFTTLRDAGGDLRGCIGFVEARFPLWETVWRTAAEAALEDPRFEPVAERELPGLGLEISVLSPLRRGTPEELEPGVHGVLISQGGLRGLLLPQVASEHGWGRERFLEACCDKAGLPHGAWRSARLDLFTAEIVSE